MSARVAAAQPSLRRTLLVWLLLPLLALVPLAALLIYRLALGTALQALDRALVDTAIALAQILEVEDGRATLPLAEQTARALRADIVDEIVFAVADGERRILAGPPPLLADTPAVPAGEWRFLATTFEGKPVRLALHGVPCGAQPCTIAVAETLAKRHEAERAALLAALVGATVLALPLVALAMLAVGHAMRPLQRAAAEVAALGPERLAPIDTRDVPREVGSLADALNGLLGRLQAAAAAQRTFVSDAAHQLRTPLAGLKSQTELALNEASEAAGPALRTRLQRVHESATRSAHLVNQLLTLARAEPESAAAQAKSRVDLRRLAGELTAEWVPRARQAGIDLGFEEDGTSPTPAVQGNALLLREAIANLIDNAIRYTGRGASVTVRVRSLGPDAQIEVEDDGPGIAPADRERVFERFARATLQGDGCGLGLAIVKEIAERHGGRVALEGAAPRGLRVLLRLPRLAA